MSLVPRALRRAGIAALVLLSACSGNTPADSAPLVSPADFNLINRLTWGASRADLLAFARLGREGWLDAQLGPPRPLPTALQSRFDALPLVAEPMGKTIVELEAQRYAATHASALEERNRLYADFRNRWAALRDQAIERSVARDLGSPNQLREQLTWFWFNHFNIKGTAGNLAAMAGDYETVIRERATGRFCDLVKATQRHPAMLVYLNNTANRAGKINENYARELMELHTLGVGTGYTQADVQTLAKVMTGAAADLKTWPEPPAPPGGVRDGLFVFDPANHDNSAKTLLGRKLRKRGLAEIDEATEILCAHPATATHVATRLAQYFVADAPPPALVERMAATYTQSGGDIAAIMRTMIASPEFEASLGTLFKDPQHYILSMLRLTLGGEAPEDAGGAVKLLAAAGQGRFARITPDGYPLTSDNWNSSGQLSARFDVATRIGSRGAGVLSAIGGIPGMGPDLKAARASGLYPKLAPATEAVLAETSRASEWNALFLSSPEFMRR